MKNKPKYLEQRCTAKGQVRLDVIRNGKKIQLLDWVDNLITDSGMNAVATTVNFGSHIAVGSGNTAPAYTDTALGAEVARAARSSASSSWDTSNNQCTITYEATFGEGVAAGNLTEVALASGAGTAPISTHALFRDVNGDPIVVIVLSDEQLLVTYRIILTYSWASDVQITEPNSGVVYGITVLPGGSAPGDPSAWMQGTALNPWQTSNSWQVRHGATSTLGAPYANPTGTSLTIATGNITLSGSNFVPGVWERDFSFRLALAAAVANDIVAFTPYPSSYGVSLKIGFSPRFNKTATNTLNFTLRLSWSRA